MAGSRPLESYRSRSTGVNALIGGVASILLAFLPFSPLIGGFISGYLHDADRSAALRVGALAGLVAFVPLLFIGMIVFLFAGIGIVAGAPRAGMAFIFIVLLAGMFAILYTVGLSAAGGYLGAIVAEEYEDTSEFSEQQTLDRTSGSRHTETLSDDDER